MGRRHHHYHPPLYITLLLPWSGLVAVEKGEAPIEEDLGARLWSQLVHPRGQVQEHFLLPS